jgi:hypothetical protein
MSSLELFQKTSKTSVEVFFKKIENPKKDQNCNVQFQDSEFLPKKKLKQEILLILENFENSEPEVLNKLNNCQNELRTKCMNYEHE